MKPILVTGATGYIGGRLVQCLLKKGLPLRLLVRDRNRLQDRPWMTEAIEVVVGDMHDPASLATALQGVEKAYYLVHGMQGGRVNAEQELQAARNFVSQAEQARLEHIIYLGELAESEGDTSPYLRSRRETGQILRSGKVPVTEFRSGMVIGAGSVLFEMVRYTAERQPVFICPRWWFTLAQPIAIDDVLAYLVAALQSPATHNEPIAVGGTTRLTYAEMLQEYSKLRDLRRLLIRTPFYLPRLSAYWVHMVTPVHWRVVLPLIQGLRHECLVPDNVAARFYPHIQPMDFKSAVRRALGSLENGDVESSWSDAMVISQGDAKPVSLTSHEGMLLEIRRLNIDLPAEAVFKAYTSLGGERGWLFMNWTWLVRGWIDKLIGGVGLRRGRRHPADLRVGDSLDFWRVEAVEHGRLLRLRAEMKVPGRAWLEFRSHPLQDGGTELVQTAYFAPRGLTGLLYWYILYPIHGFIFSGLIQRIAKLARSYLLA
jgi:uncharacterized protein YbjT (DUF2867 family)